MGGTDGKQVFSNVYNAVDAAPYLRRCCGKGYPIADHSAHINLRAIDSLIREKQSPTATTSETISNSDPSPPPLVLELCAGYGLTMSTIRTTHHSRTVVQHFEPERPLAEGGELPSEIVASDRAFFAEAARPLPPLRVCAVDIADNALAYGKSVGLFDETICRNLEEEPLEPEEAALCSQARLVLATGAFSYITSATLSKLFGCWKHGEYPVFLFCPLVATKVTH
jgi:hypothetical protein